MERVMNLFLGIDQSFTSTGICVIDEDGVVKHHETINTSDQNGDIFARANVILERIECLVLDHSPRMIGIEGLAFSKFGNATRDLAGLQMVIVAGMRRKNNRWNNDLVIVSPNLLKKYASGSGSADKDKMYEALPEDIKAVFAGYKKTKGRSDVVDAFWLSKFILDIYKKTHEANRPG